MLILRTFPTILIASVLCACSTETATTPTTGAVDTTEQVIVSLSPSADAVKAHMAYLASDELEGREAGTPGYDKAAQYVADEYKKLGLIPMGFAEGYFQPVPLTRSYRNAEAASVTAKNAKGEKIELLNNVDYAVGASRSHPISEITAQVVFAGYGIVAAKEGRDDYAGLDVEGKIVAVLARTPSGIQSEERAFYGSRKAEEASKRGAIGMVQLFTPASEAIFPFERLIKQGALDSASMSWVTSEGVPFSRAPGVKGGAGMSIEGAAKLFTDAPISYEKVLEAAAAEGGKTPTFELPITMTIKQESNIDQVGSVNVVGLIEGSDPVLKDQIIVLTAHLDHIGISKTDEEDVINNGAQDNAAGVATLLDAARMILDGPRPKRSIMLLAVTAEEKGLLGAQYFAKNPTVPLERIVGNVNLDMPVLTYEFTDVIVFGGERSTLRAAVAKAAAEMNVTIGEDPYPEQGVFTRSDHFRFVEEGVPAVFLSTGFANGGEAAWTKHFKEDYHRPSDDMDNGLDFDAAAKFAELNTRIALTIANADERPLWNKDDFFALQFNGPMTAE
jgi:hypothetical protein